MTTAQKKWKAEEIRFNMETNNKWLIHGLLAIYKRQTDDEQNAEITAHQNSVGFNGPDANVLTRMAKWYQQHGFLGKKQIDKCREKMLKYSGQLALIANGEI